MLRGGGAPCDVVIYQHFHVIGRFFFLHCWNLQLCYEEAGHRAAPNAHQAQKTTAASKKRAKRSAKKLHFRCGAIYLFISVMNFYGERKSFPTTENNWRQSSMWRQVLFGSGPTWLILQTSTEFHRTCACRCWVSMCIWIGLEQKPDEIRWSRKAG